MKQITFWRAVFGAILAAGLYSTVVRFSRGLGAATALSDQFPWGLWIGFDVLCGVGLAAGGFAITASVHVFNLERYKPILRPTVLTAFLGYVLVIVALLFDLGRPYRIWHPLVMRNPHSVMFEVAWCVMLYTTVLALEFSPVVFEKLRLERPMRILHAISVPLVIVGVLLSTLHQSSLGSLFLIMPEKLHPLWYTPLLPVFFFLSALGVGMAMVILESHLSGRAFGKRLEIGLLADLARVIVVVQAVFLVWRLEDLSSRGALHWSGASPLVAGLFLAEITLMSVLPMVLFAIPRLRRSPSGLFLGASSAVLGFVLNRLNVSITAIEAGTGVRYFPTWMEISVTMMIVAVGIALFGLAAKHLPIFEAHPTPERRLRRLWLVPAAGSAAPGATAPAAGGPASV
jgi:Ni/Fe-hydrogenase subunit HybB-like protein